LNVIRNSVLRLAPILGLALAGGWVDSAAQVTANQAEVSSPPAAWRIPPVDGELAGEFRPLTIPNAPSLKWRVVAQALPGRVRAADLFVDGPGTHLQVELRLDPAGNGTWRLIAGEMDLAVWSASAAAFLGQEFAGASVRGLIRADGDGTILDGTLGGRAQFSLRNGRIEDTARKLLIEGVQLDLMMQDLAKRQSAARQSLTWTGGHYDAIAFGLGNVDFTLSGEDVLVDEASTEVFGGEVVLASFVFSTVRREASVIARVIGVDVKFLLPLLPNVLSDARGRVDGSVSLHRSQAGVRFGGGSLALRAGETADLRLAPAPGLLSGSLPETVLKYYPGLGKIETGEVPLRAETLEVSFTPGGDPQGRTASVRIVGGPVDPSLRAPVDLNINVRGPLESLIKFGTDSRLRFGTKP